MRGQLPDLRGLLDPAGAVAAGGIVVRPSLLAAAGSVLHVAFYLALFLVVPVALFGVATEETSGRTPIWLLLFTGVWAELLPLFVGVAIAFVRIGFTRYVLDQDGIHVRTQVLATKEERVPWEKVTAVLHKRTVFDAILRIERLHVVAYGEAGRTLRLVGLRDAGPLRNVVAARMLQGSSMETLMRRD